MAIGADADESMLGDFANDPEAPLFRAENAADIHRFFRAVNLAGLAEAVLHIDPGSALTRLRSFAEELTKAIYKEELLPRMPQSSFYDLVKNPVFVDCVSKPLVHQINFLRIQGNDTAHGAEGDSCHSVAYGNACSCTPLPMTGLRVRRSSPW